MSWAAETMLFVRPSCRKKILWPTPPKWSGAKLIAASLALVDSVGQSRTHVMQCEVGGHGSTRGQNHATQLG